MLTSADVCCVLTYADDLSLRQVLVGDANEMIMREDKKPDTKLKSQSLQSLQSLHQSLSYHYFYMRKPQYTIIFYLA
jgi:hypothetical protein